MKLDSFHSKKFKLYSEHEQTGDFWYNSYDNTFSVYTKFHDIRHGGNTSSFIHLGGIDNVKKIAKILNETIEKYEKMRGEK